MERKMCIFEIQEALRNISLAYKNIPLIAADGHFGSKTKEAVKLFQDLKDINATGEVDLYTWNELFRENKRALEILKEPFQVVPVKEASLPLKPGDCNGYVEVLQKMLKAVFKDYNKFNNKGIYDLETKEGVKDWQRICRIEETGICDKCTWNLLGKFYKICF